MKKGFTLIEMLAVVIIMSLIAAITVPMVSNQLANNKSKISDTTKKLIFEATELYMSEREVDYPKLSGNTYCVSLDEIANAKLLDTPIKDFETGKEISLTKHVKVAVNANNEYDNFELLDKC